MGFCYDMDGLLCCDFCGQSGQVRKIKCPYGWCQPWATCPECKSNGKHHIPSCGGKEGQTHKDVCKQAYADFNANR